MNRYAISFDDGSVLVCNQAMVEFMGRDEGIVSVCALGIETRRAETTASCGLGAQHESPTPQGERPS